MIVPIDRLSREALTAVIEEYVTRDGTEFTDVGAKGDAVLVSLQHGELVLVYDSESDSCNILPPDQVAHETTTPGGSDQSPETIA